MATASASVAWRPSLLHLVAGSLVFAGFLLTSVSWWFLLLTAAGATGPGLLREFGALRDRDEFQQRAAYRAGYHAFLVCGVMGFALVAFLRSADRGIKDPEEIATLFLSTLWFVWLLSSLLDYWGPQKTASRMLLGFGTAWGAFVVLSNTGSEWGGWQPLAMHSLLAVPFFGLAWTSRRWPKVTGLLLLALSGFFIYFFGFLRGGYPAQITRWIVFVLFVGPLLASGAALTLQRWANDEE
ncbi:MAG: hypothetical protein KDA61_22530 [Planctomycetales bacterium]|nr:hypothetical protein [Planctomycetales bacterium]